MHKFLLTCVSVSTYRFGLLFGEPYSFAWCDTSIQNLCIHENILSAIIRLWVLKISNKVKSELQFKQMCKPKWTNALSKMNGTESGRGFTAKFQAEIQREKVRRRENTEHNALIKTHIIQRLWIESVYRYFIACDKRTLPAIASLNFVAPSTKKTRICQPTPKTTRAHTQIEMVVWAPAFTSKGDSTNWKLITRWNKTSKLLEITTLICIN